MAGNFLKSIGKFILPVALVLAAQQIFGLWGGIIAIVVYFVAAALMNRTVFYQNRSNRKYQEGDYQGALKDLEDAIRLNPKNWRNVGNYGTLLLKLGRVDEAAVQNAKAYELCDKEDEKKGLGITKSLILWRQDKLDEAIAEMEKLLETYKNSNVYASLGFLYTEKGDLEKALAFNLEAREFNDTNTIILDNLGYTYFLMGNIDEAEEIYKKLMSLKPTFPEAFYNYAMIHEIRGDLDQAVYLLRHALKLKFWHTSTITKEKVEAGVERIDSILQKAAEEEKKERLARIKEEEQEQLNGNVE